MKTVTKDFQDTLVQPAVAVRRRVYYKRRYWVESTKTYTWESGWTELDLDKIVTISSINWQLDTQNLSEFKVSNVTLSVDNLHNQWKGDNPYGYFGGDTVSPRGYESFWMKFKIAAGVRFDDEDEELITLFTGLATEYTQDSQSGHMQITLNGLEALLVNADAERVSTAVVEENAGTGNGSNKDFFTANNSVGIIDLVSVNGVTKKAGTDFTISILNDQSNAAKISFIAAPAGATTIRISYRYWKTNELFESLVGYLCTEAGIAGADQQISPVIFPNKIVNKHLFDTQTEWDAGTKTAIDTATLVDSIKIDFADATLARTVTTYVAALTGWTTYGTTQVTSNAYDTTAEFNAGTKTAIDTASSSNTIKPDYSSSSLARTLTSWADSTSGWSAIGSGAGVSISSGYLSASAGQVGQSAVAITRSSSSAYGRWDITSKAVFFWSWVFSAQSHSGSVGQIVSNGGGDDPNGFSGGYMVRTVFTGSTVVIALFRCNSGSSQTLLASQSGFANDAGTEHAFTVVRTPTGAMTVYRDGVAILAATDNTYTSASVFGFYTQQSPSLCKTGTLYVPPSSITATWLSATLDLTAAPYSWQAFARSEAPNSGTINYYTRTSTDGVSWDSYVQISGDTIGSAFKRYIQVRADLIALLTTPQNPLVTSMTIGGNISSDWTAPSSKLTYTPATSSTSGWIYRSLFKGCGRWDTSIKESAATNDTTTWFHFMFQSVGTLGVNNFFNGYSVKISWSGSSGTLKFIRNDSATIGTETELASSGIARDATSAHAIEVVRYPSGRFLIYFDTVLKVDYTDLTFTTGNFIGYHVDSSNSVTVRFGDTALYVPADSITSTWESAAIDEGSTPDAWSPIEYTQSLNGGSTAFYTRSSADNVTYDTAIAVPSSLAIQSTLRRYIKIRTDLTSDTRQNQDPTMSAFGSGSVTTSTRITLANFTGKSCYDAIQSLAQFANYEWGFTPSEKFFFRSKIVSTTPVMTLSQKDFLMRLKSVVNGFSRIYSSVRATYGSYQTDVTDDALNYLGPIARFARQRLEIDGGDILVSADADVATGVAGAFFNYYKSARRKFKIDAKFIPQLDLSDTVKASFLDNYPSKLWSLGDTTIDLGQTDINLFGNPEQTMSDTLCKVIGMRIDTEQWQTELDLEEILT